MQEEFTGKTGLGKASVPVDFLKKLRPDGPWVLTAIVPDGQIETITAKSPDEAEQFICKHDGQRNLYYALNPLRHTVTKKATKTDVAAIEYLLSDLDPKDDETPEAAKARYLAQLDALGSKATIAVDSGNGIQCAWKLTTPIMLSELVEGKFSPEDEARIKDAEERTKALMLRLGTKAGTQNIDRILRLPGTTNLPTETKKKAGRTVCPTSLLWFNGASYSLEDFPRPEEPKASPRAKRDAPKELPLELRLMLHMQGDKPAGYPSRSELLWAFICTALRRGIDETEIKDLCLSEAYAGNSICEHTKEKGGEDYVKRQIERALNEPDSSQQGKQLIRLEAGKLDEQWRQVEDALLAAKLPVYVRARSLVQPLWRWEDAGNERQILGAKLVRYNVPRLADMVAHHAVRFHKFNAKEKKWLNVDPPDKVIERLIEAGHYKLPDIIGIITSPTMRSDGSLITEPGYDAKTRLWYKPTADIDLPPLPELTKVQATAALQKLKDLIEECAFVGPVDKSVALAAIMTIVLRGAFPFAPLFFFHKPEAGTGASYLGKIISTIALGREAIPLSVSNDPKELPKELHAAAYEAKPILYLNNLTFDLESPLLSQMITEGEIDFRPFFRNTETVRCNCRAMTVLANGNNVNIVGELVRRVLSCRLDRNPYNQDPIAKIKSDRGAYLAAVFTIALAFMNRTDKEPLTIERINGFEDWSRFVQEPLVWLGEADPVTSQADARALDPERGGLKERVDALVKHIGVEKDFTANYVVELGNEPHPADVRKLRCPELFSAFDCGKRSSKSVGKQLMRDLGRQCGDYRLVLPPNDDKAGKAAKVYRLVDGSRPEDERKPEVEARPEEDEDAM